MACLPSSPNTTLLTGEKQSSTSMEEEDFIDIDLGSSSPEFEFHMTAEDPLLPSPADELFYKGKLLPLHLPPRLQMVEQLLRNTSAAIAAIAAAAAAAKPCHSCNASGELNPDEEEYFHDSLTELKPKKSRTKRLKEVALSLKFKASRSYLKSLFHRSRPSNEKLEATGRHQNPTLAEDEGRSKPSASPKPSSFSSESSGGKSTPRRSSSASSDAESSIQGAIAYCKKSSQWAVDSVARKSTSNTGFCLLSASRIAPEWEQGKPPHQIRPPPSRCASHGKKSNFCDAYLLLEHKSNAIKDFILAVSVNK